MLEQTRRKLILQRCSNNGFNFIFLISRVFNKIHWRGNWIKWFLSFLNRSGCLTKLFRVKFVFGGFFDVFWF